MSNTLQFTAISGADDEDAVCYILEIDEAKILLDCGSYENYSAETLAQLQRVARQVDAVLLSHPDVAHIGAYPLAHSRYGMTCPAYATQAVHMMGRLCMLEVVRSLRAREEFVLFGEREVDDAFENVTPLQFSQPKPLPGKHSGIVITAHAAGHTIGGAIWTISNGAETVLYAIDFNQMNEKHLNRCSLMEGSSGMVAQRLMRPTLLITDAYNALYKLPTRAKRAECFLDSIQAAIKRGGNVLVPVDSAARVLEIAYIINEWWPKDKRRRDTHSLFLLARCGRKIKSFAQSLIGWMADSIEGQLSDKDGKPFDLRHVTVVQSVEELERRMRPDPKSRARAKKAVVLAPSEGMSLGYSQELFVRWAGDRSNAVVLPQRGPPLSLARDLFNRWWERTQKNQPPGSPMKLVPPTRLHGAQIAITIKRRVPLEGGELEDWIAQDKQRKEQEAARDAILQRNRTMLDSDDMSSNGDSDNEETRDMGIVATMREVDAGAFSEIDLEMERLRSGQTFDLYVKGRGRVHDLDLQNQSYCMFPFQEKIRRADEYGEIYDLEKYMQAEEPGDDTFAPDTERAYESETEEEGDGRPTKPTKEQHQVKVNCQVSFVDMEGRADGTSVSNILVQIIPKRLVLVHGTSASTQVLASYCRDPQVPVTKDIYTPGIGEILNVSSGLNAYKVKLTDALFKQVRLASVQGCMLGYVSGRIGYMQDDDVPVLDVDYMGMAKAWLPPTFVGDPKLSLLRGVLDSQGISARFDGEGTLVCSNTVAIRRTVNKRSKADAIQIQGNPTPEYFLIRSIVYEHFATL
ncbi:hypothetical protein H4R26_002904 [Coemansia thaxteri]|uniref:Cleavage and polyadenylation specificity factor subunit 2 n=1 Tax=Coemansia thaxteri TaxID=2663907 RepID=A0A9W8BDQ8_9FUNG|nr:hypothetical protein H4R26_002904 [Coemansia thaxteri]KAJ2487987.1 hypothetical protein EV174_000224 [Coemansia sp. RSA 2320]